jgi:hypothetical protein
MKKGSTAAEDQRLADNVRPNRWLQPIMPALLWSLSFSVLFGFLGELQGATIAAKSVSLADVRSAIASARDGDTVTVPAGTATWTSSLNVDKYITLQGAGAGSTVIIDAVAGAFREQRREKGNGPNMDSKQSPRRGPARLRRFSSAKSVGLKSPRSRKQSSSLISINLARDLPFRMTGFAFKGDPATRTKTTKPRIQAAGNSHSFRIDHCTFDQLNGWHLSVDGFLWGVIDHCRFNASRRGAVLSVMHRRWNGENFGNGSWADEPHWGSEKFIFIEDNVFENGGIDSYQGARFVVRHNQFRNGKLVLHGTEGQGRGAKQVEEYGNTYVNDSPNQAGQIRSGCIVTHDNKWSNVAKGHVLQAYRQFHSSPHWGGSNGQNPYDDNAPNGTQGYWETGKHTGPDGATVLSDATKNWTANQWYQPGATYVVRNITQDARAQSAARKIQSFAISNTSNSLTCSSLTFYPGEVLTFNTGDTYQIWKVTHSLDQPGLGKGDLLTGLPGRPAKWPNQVTEPCYSWNNTALENGRAINLSSSEPSIKKGRDFLNETPKPGYEPYTHPHPLVTGNPATPRKTEEDRQRTADANSPSK